MVEGGNKDPYNGMWFGPRIGKRSLSTENDRQEFYKMLEDAEALKYYYNPLTYYEQADDPNTRGNRAVTKKVIFTPKLGRNSDEEGYRKMNDLNFTPRLGRRLPESAGVTLADVDNSVNDGSQQGSNLKNRNFSPRLGRTMTFSPRLGRDLLYDMFPPDTRIRIVRSVDKKNDTHQ